MKYSIALLALLFSCSSFAQQNGPQPPTSSVPVFERSRVKVNIYKNTIERVGDGFNEKREEVCTKYIDMDVLDVRNIQGQPQLPPLSSIICEATLNGARIHTTVWLYNLVQRPGRDDEKTYLANLTAYSSMNAPTVAMPGNGNASTKQIDLKSMIFSLTPNQGVYCYEVSQDPTKPNTLNKSMSLPFVLQKENNCQIVNPVAFGATVEFETL